MLFQQLADTVDHRHAGICRSGRDLVLVQNAVLRHQHDIGEGATDVDGNPDRVRDSCRGETTFAALSWHVAPGLD